MLYFYVSPKIVKLLMEVLFLSSRLEYLISVNLIMDNFGALATESPTDHLINRLPVGRSLQDSLGGYLIVEVQDLKLNHHYHVLVQGATVSENQSTLIALAAHATDLSEADRLKDYEHVTASIYISTTAFNEIVIEEREQGIQEIQNQIGEVNKIFKDLAVLVHEQGAIIGFKEWIVGKAMKKA
ncbi:hypothetical protein SSX86_022940 [Deinandra increscens subsp. villosa]|uniref:t-SNARE coiled-coil homology domain-containing protein n=1 Tax=Deinandra increscens subsp. villosa TaxID=3103831 RepID=A0AAP0CPU0_9ASTR